jgi:hypothetical protein
MNTYTIELRSAYIILRRFILHIITEMCPDAKINNMLLDNVSNNIDCKLTLDVHVNQDVAFTYKDMKFNFLVRTSDSIILQDKSLVNNKEYFLEVYADNNKEAKKFITTLIKDALYHDTYSGLYVYTHDGIVPGFKSFIEGKLPLKSLDTIYHTKLDSMITDIKKFRQSGPIYKEYGIPYVRKYLMCGPHGTGKSSLIHAIASMLKKDIYKCDINYQCHVDPVAQIKNAVCFLNFDACILIIERVEKLFDSVDPDEVFSVLNGLDRKNGLMIFMTTIKSDVDSFDDKFEPGSIDYSIAMVHPNKETVKQMFFKFLPQSTVDEFNSFYNQLSGCSLRFGVLEKFFLEHTTIDDIKAATSKLVAQSTKKKNSNMVYN